MQNFEDNILAYLENELSEKERTDFEQELAKNKALQVALKEIKFAKDSLAELKQEQQVEAEIERRTPELNAELARIIANIVAEKETTIIPIIETKKNNFRRYFAMAAAIFLILGLGWWFSQEKENPYLQQHFIDYAAQTEMGTEKNGFIDLSEAYQKRDFEAFREILPNVVGKDSTESYTLYMMKGTVEKHRKLYPDALASFQSAELFAKKNKDKTAAIVNQIALLLATEQKEKAKQNLEKLLQDVPNAAENESVKKLKKELL